MLVFLIRLIFFVAMAASGYHFGMALSGGDAVLSDRPFWGMVVFMVLALVFVGLDALYRRKDISVISAVFFGLIAGLVVSMLMGPIIEMSAWPATAEAKGALKVAVAVVASYLAVSLILQTRSDFRFILPYIEFAKQAKGGRPMLLDTSAIIDGRIADIAESRFLDAPLVVPRFVLRELQAVADAEDKLKRNRGRRGLDMLNRLRTNPEVDITIDDAAPPVGPGAGVDEMLVSLAQQRSARVVTGDYNLNKVARVRDVDVININDLANALKPAFLPGEPLEVDLVREGQEEGQGVGYLDDGTMVVVENGRGHVGSRVNLTVTSCLQTSAGRMVFGRLGDDGNYGRRGRK